MQDDDMPAKIILLAVCFVHGLTLLATLVVRTSGFTSARKIDYVGTIQTSVLESTREGAGDWTARASLDNSTTILITVPSYAGSAKAAAL